MLEAYCDRCSVKIEDYDRDKNQLMVINPSDEQIVTFDLCDSCGITISAQISDFIKGA